MNCFLLSLEHVLLLLSMLTDPSPTPGEAGLSEQCLSDLHGVVPRHLFRRIRTFDIKLVGLRDHAGIIVTRDRGVQRHM